jgi:F420-non-reducing hydrogenase iron-sulfur subunit
MHVWSEKYMNEESKEKNEVFEPKIVGFLCNWCSYAGADLAGTSRIQYPPNVRIIRVMCSGSVDSMYILRALLEGADGVFVGGCHPGDCHYIDGNYKARRRMVLLENILETLGLEKERVWLRWISASEGQKFADTMKDMTEAIRKLGPNPIGKHWNL